MQEGRRGQWFQNVTESVMPHAVFSAVVFLGERFTAINVLGLVILILGVVLFNWTKYRRLKEDLPATEASKAHPVPIRPQYTLVDQNNTVGALCYKWVAWNNHHCAGRSKATHFCTSTLNILYGSPAF